MQPKGTRELRLLGDAIRRERKRLDVSQEDFAEICDVHRTYISQVERGVINISFDNLVRIAKGFKVKPSVMFDWAGL
jgi:transcriptional regulator with XRE-family HTH domain